MEVIGEEGFFISHGEPRQHLHPCHHHHQGFPCGSVVKNLPANAGGMGSTLGEEDALYEEMATHSSIPACRIPWTEEPGEL